MTNIVIRSIPFPYEETFEQEIDALLISADHIVIQSSELHDRTVDFIRRYQHSKITYLLCGRVNGIDHGLWLDWFIRGTRLYKETTLLDQLNPYITKPKTFDILLGLNRPHRDIIYNYINQNNLNDRVVMTYINNRESIPMENSDVYIWEDGIELPNNNIKWTVTPVKYHNKTPSLSQIVPINIYNQTAYSVVAETNFSDNFVFHTEKIVKPILAERLFIVFGGVGYLKHLRDLGFKTFNTVIDESYDLELDFRKRGKLICEQIRFLIEQDQQEILEKIQPIVQHNKQIMLTTDWSEQLSKILSSVDNNVK